MHFFHRAAGTGAIAIVFAHCREADAYVMVDVAPVCNVDGHAVQNMSFTSASRLA